MKPFYDTLNWVLFMSFILALVFVFKGDPSLWTLLHAKVMAWAKGA